MEPTRQRTSSHREDADGKPVMPLCKECGVPVVECVEAKTHHYTTKLSKSVRSLFRCWKRRIEKWKSGSPLCISLKGRELPQEVKDKLSVNAKLRYSLNPKKCRHSPQEVLDQSGPVPRAKPQTVDAEGKPVMPLCVRCGVPVVECIEARTHPRLTPLYGSNQKRFLLWKKRMKKWESGAPLRTSLKGRKRPQEVANKLALGNIGRVVSQQTRLKMSASQLNRADFNEIAEKMAQGRRESLALKRMAALTKVS